ncbi:hypothetical protein ACLMJK_003933 [Lecanora helva]
MKSPTQGSEQGEGEPKLRQTTITSAFFAPKGIRAQSDAVESASRYKEPDSQEPQVNEKAQDMPLNLFFGRRSQKSQPKPSMTGASRSTLLSHIAAETKTLLPNILKTTPKAPPNGHLYDPKTLHPLDPQKCPNLPKTTIRVLNSDTIDAALSLSSPKSPKPVLILNMANAYHSGGGWLHGSLAQEEALCYRSSLSFTLKTKYYPIPEAGGIYSPTVVVIRENMASGHALLDLSKPEDLPVVSAVSVAAINGPKIAKDAGGKETFKAKKDRDVMKEKMRVVLRIAAVNHHRVLVLGALGCGAFGNPRGEVVECWKEVFAEAEFNGGWWETVAFAVMEPKDTKEGNGNFGVFWRGLNGLLI